MIDFFYSGRDQSNVVGDSGGGGGVMSACLLRGEEIMLGYSCTSYNDTQDRH